MVSKFHWQSLNRLETFITQHNINLVLEPWLKITIHLFFSELTNLAFWIGKVECLEHCLSCGWLKFLLNRLSQLFRNLNPINYMHLWQIKRLTSFEWTDSSSCSNSWILFFWNDNVSHSTHHSFFRKDNKNFLNGQPQPFKWMIFFEWITSAVQTDDYFFLEQITSAIGTDEYFFE